MKLRPTCIHCGNVIHEDDTCVCSCQLTPGVHMICRACLSNRKPIAAQNADWVNPLSLARINRVNAVRGRELFRQAPRGDA